MRACFSALLVPLINSMQKLVFLPVQYLCSPWPLCKPLGSITVRVVSRPDPQFDGVTEVNFSTEGIGATRGNYSNVSFAGSSRAQAPSATEDSGGVGVAVQHGMEVTFYHCREGNFWNMTPSSDGDYATCKLCTDSAEGDTEVMSARGYVDSDLLFTYF